MGVIWRALRAPRLALVVLLFLAAYCGFAAWFPWSAGSGAVPGWARALGLDRPFNAVLFLSALGMLFLSTLACTAARVPRVLALWRGRLDSAGIALTVLGNSDLAAFLGGRGFRRRGEPWWRFRFAVWGGVVLHAGLLALMLGVLVQQAFHDGGAFELAEGESARLATPGTVFGRDRGVLAPAHPPDLTVALLAFDPFVHQGGYAPDRRSRLRVTRGEKLVRDGLVDRAAGFDAGPAAIYQAIPTGLALAVELPGSEPRVFRLRNDSATQASARFDAPGGGTTRIEVRCTQPIDDPMGTGKLSIAVEREGGRTEIGPDGRFRFGHLDARIVSVTRWGGYTYSRSPGMPGVYLGFALILSGAFLMAFPAAAVVSRPREDGKTEWLHAGRGREALQAEWDAVSSGAVGGAPVGG